jgi:hypothetical protein
MCATVRHRAPAPAPLEAAEEASIASGPGFVSRSVGEPGDARPADTGPRESLPTGLSASVFSID